jgi:hypothetical protein
VSDLKKLPVWAQKHIATLEMRLREIQEELAERKENKPTGVIVNPFGTVTKFYLPDDARIHFQLDNEDEGLSVRRIVTDLGHGLEVSLVRGVCLAVMPRVASVVHIAPAAPKEPTQ